MVGETRMGFLLSQVSKTRPFYYAQGRLWGTLFRAELTVVGICASHEQQIVRSAYPTARAPSVLRSG
jgi:hypothetical protein